MPFGRFLTVPCALIGVLLLTHVARKYRLPLTALMLIATLGGLWQITVYKFGSYPFLGRFNLEATQFDAAWIDNRNAVHARDIVFIQALLKAIEEHPKDTLSIASIQMGMVPYYISRETTKEVTFFDMRGLATIDVHNCAAVTDPFLYDPYQPAMLQALTECNGQPFDIIYDLAVEGYSEAVLEFGCALTLRTRYRFISTRFREDYKPATFIADCSTGLSS